MTAKERRGLSPEEFVSRVQDTESVVRNWPFGHMPDDKRYEAVYSYDAIDQHPGDNTKTLVVGRIIPDRKTISMNIKNDQIGEPNYKLDFGMQDEQEIKAWKQMLGVNVALQVELGSEKIESRSTTRGDRKIVWNESTRQARITRVLGIEQPLYSKVSGEREGFIQGAVLGREAHTADTSLGLSERNYEIQLALSKHPKKATLAIHTPQLFDVSIHKLVARAIQADDEIRARVARYPSPKMYQQIEPTLFILNKYLPKEGKETLLFEA